MNAPAQASFRWNVPNVLTILRMMLAPVVLVMLLAHPGEQGWRLATTLLFVAAVLTDFVDGRIARSTGQVTNFGKLWDPIADKALTGVAFVGLAILGELWWWVAVVVLARELAVTGLREHLKRQGQIMPAGPGGKLKTATQSVALTLYLLGLASLPAWLAWTGHVTMGLCVALTVATGVHYFVLARRHL